MTICATIEFTGLTGLVPNRKTPKDPIESCLAVLPDLKASFEHKELAHTVPPHVPAVIVPTDCVVRESGKHAAMRFRCKEGTFGGEDFSLFVFDYELLTFEGLKPGRLTTEFDPLQGDRKKPAPGEEQQIQWIPQMSLANQIPDRNVGVFNRRRFVNGDLTPKFDPSPKLIGTTSLTAGRLYVQDVVRRKGEPLLYDFKVPGAAEAEWQQAMFTRMICDAEMSGGRLTLVFTTEEGNRSEVTVAAAHGRCDVWIANLELEELLGIGETTEPDARRGPDNDYAVFYLFSDRSAEAKDLPVPVRPGDVAGGNLRCKPPQFS